MEAIRTRILIDENSDPLTFRELPDEEIVLEGAIVTRPSDTGEEIKEWDGDTLGFAPFPTNGLGWRWEIRFLVESPFLQATLDSELSAGEPMPPLPPDAQVDPDENPGLVPEMGDTVTMVDDSTEDVFSYEIKAFFGTLESQPITRRMRIRRRLG